MRTRIILAAMLIFTGTSIATVLAGGGGNFDFLKDDDRKVLEELFVKEIYPMLQKDGKQGCVGCHNGKIVSSLKMSGDARKDFKMLVKEGFFLPGDSGSLLTRIQSTNRKQRMPPPGKGEPWTKDEAEVLHKFVADLDKKQQKKVK